MALTIANGGGGSGGRGGILYNNPTKQYPYTHLPIRRHVLIFPLSTRTTTTLHMVSAKRFSSRTGRLDGKNRRSSTTTKDQDENQDKDDNTVSFESVGSVGSFEDNGVANVSADGVAMPDLPGLETDFWEGPQWDAFGFFVQYMWAFGIGFAVFFFLWFRLSVLVFVDMSYVDWWGFSYTHFYMIILC